MRRFTSTFLALVMVIGILCALPMGATATTFGDYDTRYIDANYNVVFDTVNVKGVEIRNYNGSASTLTIPNQINGYPVTLISWGAFRNNNSLTNVTIPGSVKKIEASAFAGCSLLTKSYN